MTSRGVADNAPLGGGELREVLAGVVAAGRGGCVTSRRPLARKPKTQETSMSVCSRRKRCTTAYVVYAVERGADEEPEIEASLLETGENAENQLEFAPSGVPEVVFDVAEVRREDDKPVRAF